MQKKKRILFLGGTHGDWGGASRVLFNTLRMLDRSKFDPIVLLPQEGPANKILTELGIAHQLWPAVTEPSAGLVRYARAVLRACQMMHDTRAELLDVNFNYWRPAEVLAAWLMRIPIVTHFHVIVRTPGPFIRFSRAVTAVSQFAATASSSAGRRIVVLPNTVVLPRFDGALSLREELGIQVSEVVVSFVGQIRENKGIDSFLRVANALGEANLRFLIVGECRDPNRFEGAYTEARLRSEIGTNSRVLYLGYRTDVERVYRSSDILVVPSRWGEPFGLINIEAGAVRIPVVAMRDGGIPEIIRDGENGLLVDVGDEAGLIAAVRRLVSDPELRSRLGRRAREIVEQEYTDKPVRLLEQLYLELMGA